MNLKIKSKIKQKIIITRISRPLYLITPYHLVGQALVEYVGVGLKKLKKTIIL
jgi:hypothetical protein